MLRIKARVLGSFVEYIMLRVDRRRARVYIFRKIIFSWWLRRAQSLTLVYLRIFINPVKFVILTFYLDSYFYVCVVFSKAEKVREWHSQVHSCDEFDVPPAYFSNRSKIETTLKQNVCSVKLYELPCFPQHVPLIIRSTSRGISAFTDIIYSAHLSHNFYVCRGIA